VSCLIVSVIFELEWRQSFCDTLSRFHAYAPASDRQAFVEATHDVQHTVVLCDTWNHDNDTDSGIAILDTTAIPELHVKS